MRTLMPSYHSPPLDRTNPGAWNVLITAYDGDAFAMKYVKWELLRTGELASWYRSNSKGHHRHSDPKPICCSRRSGWVMCRTSSGWPCNALCEYIPCDAWPTGLTDLIPIAIRNCPTRWCVVSSIRLRKSLCLSTLHDFSPSLVPDLHQFVILVHTTRYSIAYPPTSCAIHWAKHVTSGTSVLLIFA
jgi:hypothetical protein